MPRRLAILFWMLAAVGLVGCDRLPGRPDESEPRRFDRRSPWILPAKILREMTSSWSSRAMSRLSIRSSTRLGRLWEGVMVPN